MALLRRNAIGTQTLANTNKTAVALTFATGVSGGGTQGYLRARGGNSAALFLSQFSTNNDNEPRARLAAGETYPVLLSYEAAVLLYVKGAASDVLEFVADATE